MKTLELSQAKRYWSLLGSRHFLDLPVLITFVCVTVVTGSLVQGAPNVTINFVTLGRVTLVAFVLALVLLAIKFITGLLPNWTPSSITVALLFLGIGIVRFESVRAIEATPDSRVANVWTAPIAILQMFVALSTAAIVTALIAEFRTQFAAAQNSQAQLLQLAATMQERVESARRELVDKTRAQLEPMMQALRTQFGGQSTSDQRAMKIAEMLSSAVSDLVRPMSHNLATEKLQVPMELESPTTAPGQRPDPMVDVRDAISPFWLFITGALGLVAVNRSLGFDISVAIKPLLFIVVTYFIFKFLLHIWPERYRLLPRSVMLMTVLAIFVVMTLLQSAVWLVANDLELPLAAFIGGIPLRVGVFMAVSLMTIGTANLRHAAEELEASNDKLGLLISTLKRELWMVQRGLALSLHGSVQSALVSSQILLSRPNVSDDDLAEALHRIEEALVRLGADHARTPEINLAMAEISGLWQDTVEINVNIPDDCKQRMAGDVGLTSAAAEIVRECVSNAVRHGEATEVSINCAIDDESLLELSISNNGRPLPDETVAGLGTRMLDDVTHQWSRTNRDGRVELVALLA